MDPLAKLKIAALGALVARLDPADLPVRLDFEELDKAPGVTVDADPSSKTLIVQLVEEEDE